MSKPEQPEGVEAPKTTGQVLKALAEMAAEDGILNDEASLLDLLDYLGILGVPGSSDAYFQQLPARRARRVTKRRPLRDYLAAHAPEHPLWLFDPRMPTPRPELKWPDLARLGEPGAEAGNGKEVDAWDRARDRARAAQWPWVWADAVLAARAVKS